MVALRHASSAVLGSCGPPGSPDSAGCEGAPICPESPEPAGWPILLIGPSSCRRAVRRTDQEYGMARSLGCECLNLGVRANVEVRTSNPHVGDCLLEHGRALGRSKFGDWDDLGCLAAGEGHSAGSPCVLDPRDFPVRSYEPALTAFNHERDRSGAGQSATAPRDREHVVVLRPDTQRREA